MNLNALLKDEGPQINKASVTSEDDPFEKKE